MFAGRTLAEWKAVLGRQEGPWTVVQYPAEVARDPQAEANGYVQTVAYGDGNQQDITAALPKTVTHTYAVADDYTVVVFPAAPCTGKFTDRLQVAPRAGIRITDVTLCS